MTDTLNLRFPKARSDHARQVLERIAWRGYIPPQSDDAELVLWELPADQIDLIRMVLFRNRRLAGETEAARNAVEQVCETIAEESRRQGIRPDYGYE